MAEEIKVVLEADASQLTSEFKKAQKSASALAKDSLPLVTASLDRAYIQGQKLEKGMKASGRGFRSNGDSLIVFAQAADDAQYGMRGLSNQIPQLAQAIGLGGGLAGAIGIAAVAVTVLLPLLKKLYTDTDAPKIKAVADAIAKRYAAELEGIRAVTREKEIAERVGALTSDIAAYASQELRIQDQRLTVIENQRREMELQRGLADEITAALGGPSTAENTRLARIQQDLELARKEAKIANEEYDRIAADQANVQTGVAARLAAADAEIARLQRNVAGGKANLAGADEAEKQKLHGYGERRGRAQAQLERDTPLLEEQTALAAKLREEVEKANALGKGALGDLSARIEAADRQKRIYEKTLPIARQLAEIEKERNRQAAIAAEADFRKNLVDTIVGGVPDIKARFQAEKDRKAAIAASRQEFAQDQRVLELRARGMNAAADALEREIRLRRESVGLAKSLGVDEAKALELLRQRQRLTDRINGGGGAGTPGSKIRRSTGISAGSGGLYSRLDGPRGLRSSAEEAERRSRATTGSSLEAKAASYYERSLSNEERMVKAFESLGIL